MKLSSPVITPLRRFCGMRRTQFAILVLVLLIILTVGATRQCPLLPDHHPGSAQAGEGWVAAPDQDGRAAVRASLSRQVSHMCEFFVERQHACRRDYNCLLRLLARQPPERLLRPVRRCWRMLGGMWKRTSVPLAVRLCTSTNSYRRVTPEMLERVMSVNGCPRLGKYVWFQILIRNEARLLTENLLYHLSLGVEHFIIHDHGSSDNLLEALQPFMARGLVTYRTLPAGKVLPWVYDQGVDIARQQGVRWVFAIDTDELVVSNRSTCLAPILQGVEQQHADTVGSFAINWRMVGRDPLLDTSGMLQPERSALSIGEADQHIKSFVRPDRSLHYLDPHHVNHPAPYVCVSPNGNTVHGPFHIPPDAEDTALLHFFGKSPAEWVRKRMRGRGDMDNDALKLEQHHFYNDNALSILQEWSSMNIASPLPDHPLTASLTNNVQRLRQAIEGA